MSQTAECVWNNTDELYKRILEIWVLLGYCTAYNRNFLLRFRRKTYRSHPQRSWTPSWPLNMEPVGCPETSPRNYHYTLCNTTEERKFHLLRHGSLKSSNRILLPSKWGGLHFFHVYFRLRQDPAQKTTGHFEDLKCLMAVAKELACGSENWTNTTKSCRNIHGPNAKCVQTVYQMEPTVYKDKLNVLLTVHHSISV
jgi:hypothetical protein